MKVLAIKTSGDHTSISVILNDEVNTFSMSHERKDRPDWNFFLANIGHKRTFSLKDIDLFAFANSQDSYTATRTVASYLKGIAVALTKPLMAIDDEDDKSFEADMVAKIAKENFLAADKNYNQFDPNNANPTYTQETTFKKLDE